MAPATIHPSPETAPDLPSHVDKSAASFAEKWTPNIAEKVKQNIRAARKTQPQQALGKATAKPGQSIQKATRITKEPAPLTAAAPKRLNRARKPQQQRRPTAKQQADVQDVIPTPPASSVPFSREVSTGRAAAGMTEGEIQYMTSIDTAPDRLLHAAPSRLETGTNRLESTTVGNTTVDNTMIDIQFVEACIQRVQKQAKIKADTVGRRQARRIQGLLPESKAPNQHEALYMTREAAAQYLATSSFFSGPIIVRDAQSLPLQTVDEFLAEFYDDSINVSIQDPRTELKKKNHSVREVTVAQVKQHLSQERVLAPWNCLELAAHVEDGLRPSFLNSEECRLLTKLKIPSEDDSAGRRGYAPGWKDKEKWALIARAGALTEPHQDSGGLGTYITINQGVVGFGWLSRPTSEEKQDWLANPGSFVGGQWRRIVLRAGDTIYFPGGTVHFVFRDPKESNTLAFGGHVLRCSQIATWIETLLQDQANPNITNEDLSASVVGYLERVERFVYHATVKGTQALWGGQESIDRFVRMKAEFLAQEPVTLPGAASEWDDDVA